MHLKSQIGHYSSQVFCLLLSFMLFTVSTVAGDSFNAPAQQVASSDSVSSPNGEFNGSTESEDDYEALIKELYGPKKIKVQSQDAQVEPVPPDKREKVTGVAPGKFKNSALNGSHITINGSSPFAVSEQLLSWYSYIDGGITFKLPYEVDVESIPLYLLLEISSFSFENSYPEGGEFAGISYVMQASSIGDHAGAVLGLGFWDKSLGSMLELNYRFRPTTNTFFRLGTRGVLVTAAESLGETWWIEFRLSMGLEL